MLIEDDVFRLVKTEGTLKTLDPDFRQDDSFEVEGISAVIWLQFGVTTVQRSGPQTVIPAQAGIHGQTGRKQLQVAEQ